MTVGEHRKTTTVAVSRQAVFTLLLAFLLLPLPACASLEGGSADAHVVAAPISERANTVLHHCVMEYSSADGRWAACLSPGCAQIWGTYFGYRAGVRRDREDVIRIGRATAERASGELQEMFLSSIFGDVDPDDPAVNAFPAMAISGSLGDRGMDALIFKEGVGRLGDLPNPETKQCAGLAALLAEASRLMPEDADAHLARAREFAAGAKGGGDGVYAFLAWAAIARASGEDDDLERARESSEGTPYRFDPGTGGLAPMENHHEILSTHLAMVHALCDYAQAAGDRSARSRAVTLLDHLFSDVWFDGRALIHDRLSGVPSKDVCSGCNLMALYLVDRLYGDAFVIDPVPTPPERDWPEEVVLRGWDHTLVLPAGTEEKPGTAEFTLTDLPPRGRILLRHEVLDAQVKFEFSSTMATSEEERGGILLEVRPRGEDSRFNRNTYGHPLSFDENGTARIDEHGFYPILWSVTFSRQEDGSLAAVINARER